MVGWSDGREGKSGEIEIKISGKVGLQMRVTRVDVWMIYNGCLLPESLMKIYVR